MTKSEVMERLTFAEKQFAMFSALAENDQSYATDEAHYASEVERLKEILKDLE